MKKRVVSVLLVLVLMFCVPAYAHSGRTDSSGGHHDYNNVSGLGPYHYHHGYGPHLHPNGICPYEQNTYSSSSNVSSSSKSSSQPVKVLGKTAASDIKAYIDYYFVPTINFDNKTYIVVEDLGNYGYDVTWDSSDRTLKIKRNTSKTISEIASQNMSTQYTVQSSDIKTYFYNDVKNSYTIVPSYNIGGKTIVSLSNIGTRIWDSQNRCIYVTI